MGYCNVNWFCILQNLFNFIVVLQITRGAIIQPIILLSGGVIVAVAIHIAQIP